MVKDNDLNKLEQRNLKTICRLCLIQGHYLREVNGTMIWMIQYSLDLDVTVTTQDQLTHICVQCFRQVIKFYTFKKKVEKNDRMLKKALRCMPKTKDIINIALEKSDLNPSEMNEVQNDDTIKCDSISEKVVISKARIKTDEVLGESHNKNIKLHYNPVHCKENHNLSVVPNTVASTDLDALQKQQNPSCLSYHIEPPPLVPLHSIMDKRGDTNKLLEINAFNSLMPKNLSEISAQEPPPLVPIVPVKSTSETVTEGITNLAQFSCNVCKVKFEFLTALKEHKLKNNCKIDTRECNICKKKFMERKKLIVHLKGHKITKEYLCNVCGKRYLSQSTFRIHFKSHTGDRPFKCGLCNKGFVRWAGVKNHMASHEDCKPFTCFCGKGFKSASNLSRHQQIHRGEYKFSCTYCNKGFYQSGHLTLHIRTYHTNEKPYLCCECGKGFVTLQRLQRHELTHSDRKPFPCSLCLRAYSNSTDLKNHNLRVHNKNENKDEFRKYPCSVCGLRFRYPSRLTKHMKTHLNLQRNCDTCGHSFKCVQALTRHLKASRCKKVTPEIQSVPN